MVEFVQHLVEYLPDYELVCEHEHSTCVLAVHKRVRFTALQLYFSALSSLISTHYCPMFPGMLPPQLRIQGRWYTWIDYDKFLELVKSGQPFSTQDYASPTPEWALVGSATRGFDPNEVRYRKERRGNAADQEG